jgi:hypothetical protein
MRQNRIDPRSSNLAPLLRTGHANTFAWTDRDLAEMFDHQLRTPLLKFLRLAPADLDLLSSLAPAPEQAALLTFGDVFKHSNPPVQILRLIKDYAKHAGADAENSLPRPLASALYSLAIAAALVRGGHRITAMKNPEITEGLDWIIAQSWIDISMRQLATQALALLSQS